MLERRKDTTPDRALLVGVYSRDEVADPDRELDELASLVEAAGGSVVGRTHQRSSGQGAIHAATYVGRGKADHMAELAKAHEANVVVFDNELSPAQIRELEKVVGCRVIDRSELILDIFAGRARTREAKLQVELAQLQYTAPRLRGMWTHLERQAGNAGGIGSRRGPGEKQIEIDRRLVGTRLARLRRELGAIERRREREVDARSGKHFCVGLVGYTNAGKSTLMNALTSAETYAADQLFATLDTKTRAWRPRPGTTVMLSDTVGFVRDLPHYLVASFRATLEEALGADLLLHVVDASHPSALEQVETVESVLDELGCDRSRVVGILNKSDAITEDSQLEALRARMPRSVVVSAVSGAGLDTLAELVVQEVRAAGARVRVQASTAAGRLIAFARANGDIHSETLEGSDWSAELTLGRPLLGRLRFLVEAERDAQLVELG